MTDNLAAVAAIYEAFGRGDVPAILERLDDDVSWDEGIRDTGLPYLAPGRGKAHVQAFFGHLAATLQFTQFDIGTLCAGGNLVMAPIMHAGQIIGGGEIPSNPEVHIWELDERGKVVRFQHISEWAPHETAFAQRAAATATA